MERNKKKAAERNDEVEELLQAAEDELLLKLSLHSHISRLAPDYLPSDLDRRFQALKSRPSVPPNPSSHSLSPPQNSQESTTSSVDQDELSARFLALKGSHGIPADPKLSSSGDDDAAAAEDEEDEVEKLIQWAKDAARLERSPSSDDEDDDDDDDDDPAKVHPRK
ncbi:uncharacterized protein LOC133865572 [Alnus glutinosa]|uniref:uncharacterized protein LOC133865572 n=1 Tax=Alnus glutinosa TaxID=3517 RepID=UPI002D777DE0|nr:uncharacterized protein LOC133865572 [Alnus glutinosa]